MKKSFRLLLALLLIGSFAFSFSSCKDSENVSDDPNSPENIAAQKKWEAAQALQSILSFTSGLDSLPNNWDSPNYSVEPTVGIVNDKSTPYVRYIPVFNKEEAIAKYNSFAAKSISDNETSASWNIENVGSLSFNIQDQADVTATLDINIKQQPHLTQIRFVPADALGENAKVEDPYYNFGDIVALTEGKNTSYWICVRPCLETGKKSTSHWMSFNLNDVDSKKNANVASDDVNFEKLTSGSNTYIVPRKLGDESKSREHLQNLFRLLKVLIEPKKYTDVPNLTLGKVKKSIFTQEDVDLIAEQWNTKGCWDKIFNGGITASDLATSVCQDKKVNVFYKGNSKPWFGTYPIVYMSTLVGEDLSYAADKGDEKIECKWSDDGQKLNFKDYVDPGQLSHTLANAFNLPQTAFIVRCKTGAQLIGDSWGNDEAPEESFTVKHANTIKDVFVYKEVKKTVDHGASVMGDQILNNDFTYEYCVLSHSDHGPKAWGMNSYYFKSWDSSSDDTNDIFLQEANVTTSAYMHLLNALIINSEEYAEYCAAVDGTLLGNLPTYYKKGLNALYRGLVSELTTTGLKSAAKFRALDKNLKPVTSDNVKNLAYFAVKMLYKDKNLSKSFRATDLLFDVKRKKYQQTDSEVYAAISGTTLIIKAYIDGGNTQPSIKDGQEFIKTITENRKDVKDACVDFINTTLDLQN